MARAAAGTARGAAAPMATHREFTPRKAGAIAAKAPRVATALTRREGADTGKGAGADGTAIAGRETRDERKTAGDEATRHDRRKKTVSRTVARKDAAAQRKGLGDERVTDPRAKSRSFFEPHKLRANP